MKAPNLLCRVASAASAASYIPPAYIQTKQWRAAQTWYRTGKSNECEKYQIRTIEQILGQTLEKTTERINTETAQISHIAAPLKHVNGYEWTENFDGKLCRGGGAAAAAPIYFNFKFICNSGGSQTRTLREVYHFVKYQLEHLTKYAAAAAPTPPQFVNILDGDESYKHREKFQYLLAQTKYENVSSRVFVGDLYDFQIKFTSPQ